MKLSFFFSMFVLSASAMAGSDITKQYNDFAEKFSTIASENNQDSNEVYYRYLDFSLEGKKVLDLGCGSGFDLMKLKPKNGIFYGIDASEEMVRLAQNNNPDADIRIGYFEAIPFPETFFDVVISKWGFQTSPFMNPIYQEIIRVLKPGGQLVFLTGHPMQQFVQKNYKGKNYFDKEIIESHIFDGQLTLLEPSHTLNEYLSPLFFEHFILEGFEEGYDSGSEKIDGDTVASFLVVKARLKKQVNS